jgi:hypothetical protein
MSAPTETVPGIPLVLGGRTYVVPPLSLGSLRRLQDRLTAISTADALAPATVDTVIEAAHAALRRNYPALTADDLAELVDVGNMHDVISCVLDVSGLKRKEGEASKNAPAQTAGATPPTGQP